VVTTPGIDGQAGWSPEVTAEQFQLLVEQVKDYAIFLLDPEGRVASWNRGAERITGYSATEILGKHFACFYPPEDAAAGKPAKALASATRTGRYQERGWRVRKDGERYFAQVSITALFDEHGEPRGFAKITRDSTSDLQAERTLREREQQLAEAQAVAKLGSFEWDLTTDRVTWSPELARIYGLHPASSSASLDGFLRQIHPDDRAAVTKTVRHAAVTGMPFRLEGRVVRPTGEPRLVASWGEVARNEQGRPWRVLGVCQDVTELRQREERLAEANAREELSRRLQSGLLPSLSLRGSSLWLGTRYQPGQERALLGADFFDVLDLPDGTVALLIGDVAGHGPDEAAVGVALRAAWRALVLTGHGAGELLNGLDQVLVRERPSVEVFTTVCCAWISPDRNRVTVALAGHPPPLLARDGTVEVVTAPAGPALGIHEDGHQWEPVLVEVGDAWTLLCYTDGLIEGLAAPGSVERFGIDALVEEVARLLGAPAELDELLDGVLEVVHAANGGDLSDDVAIVCLSRSPRTAGTLASPPAAGQPDLARRRSGTPATNGPAGMIERSGRASRRPAATDRIELHPGASSPARARRFLSERSTAWSLPEPLGDQLALIASELVTNAVLHAHTPLTLTIELRDDRVRVSVRDGSSPPAALRHYRQDALTGRDLGVIAAVSQAWGIEPAVDGKVIWAEFYLAGGTSRPAEPNDQHHAAPEPSPGGPGARKIRFLAVPVSGYRELQAHNDALFRELQLIRIGLRTGSADATPMPPAWPA
jgi:PAS domain S-box-containing protein